MPTYDYVCDACAHAFEEFQSMKDAPLRVCPKCGKSKLRRLIGAGAGIIFKGSGFYQTDYKNGGQSAAKNSEGGSKAPPAGKHSDAGKPSDAGKHSDAGKPNDSPAKSSGDDKSCGSCGKTGPNVCD